MQKKKAIIIGSGFGGLSSAGILSKVGYEVHVFEKNEQTGGRASKLSKDGYTFDMGPSWYLMPEVFEHYFELLEENIDDYLELEKMSPSYRVYFKDSERTKGPVDIFSDLDKAMELFEEIEPGSSKHFLKFLEEAEFKYKVSLRSFLYKNYDSPLDFINRDSILHGWRLNIFKNMQKYVEKYFKTEEMQKIMQYTLVFLGSSPYNTPAIYSLMTHVDFNGGVFFPKGGMWSVVDAMQRAAEKYGAKFTMNSPVKKILVEGGKAVGVELESGEEHRADIVISNADQYFSETKLLDREHQTYPEEYWEKAIPAPSGFMMYLGVDGNLPEVKHHTLIFAKDWKKGFAEIFDDPQIPNDPSLYICNASKSDKTLAPEGKENMFILVPVAATVRFSEEEKKEFGDKIIETIAAEIGVPDFGDRIEVKEYFTPADFESRYHAFRGTALGLAHTLFQTGYFRPSNVSKKVENLYYVGHNTTPGIGVPMCLISGELMYKRLIGDNSRGPLEKLQSK